MSVPDVIATGELLVDFVSTVSGVTLIQAPAFQKAPGGAPANVAAGLAKRGVAAGFMGQVGDDPFGYFLAQTMQDLGVDTSNLCYSNEARTALAFVSLHADGEREFMFYRHPSADMLFAPEQVNASYVRSARILHFGSISLLGESSRRATLYAVEIARQAGLVISYDPNLRLNLWPDPQSARAAILSAWPLANVIKVSEEELAFLSGCEVGDLHSGAGQVWHPGLRLLAVTLGRAGCCFFTPAFSGNVPGFQVEAMDSTGAGDGFVAGLLKGLIEHPRALSSEAELYEVCRYANAVGAITTTQRGAIPALPTARQVDEFLGDNHARRTAA